MPSDVSLMSRGSSAKPGAAALEDLPFFLDEFDLSAAHPAAWTNVVQWTNELAQPASRDLAAERVAQYLSRAPDSEDDILEREMVIAVAARRLGFALKHGPQSISVRTATAALDASMARALDREDVPSMDACVARDKLRRDVIASAQWDGALSYEMFQLRQQQQQSAGRAQPWRPKIDRVFVAESATASILCSMSLGLAVALLAVPPGSSTSLPTVAAALMFVQAVAVTALSAAKPESVALPSLSARVLSVTAIDVFAAAWILASPEQAGTGAALAQFLVLAILLTMAVDVVATP